MLVIRTDATPLTGAGHAMRCLNLAEAWIEDIQASVALVGELTIDFVCERARDLGVSIHPPNEWPLGEVLVVDSYDEVVRGVAARIGAFGLRVLVDDLGEPVPFGFDVVWNPNAYGSPGLYPGFKGIVLTGTNAVPVNSRLSTWTGQGSDRIGVALGGGAIDPRLVEILVQAAAAWPSLRFGGVGAWVPREWDQFSAREPWRKLGQCARVVVAGGTMTWEAARVGVPVVVVQTAGNQQLVANWARAQASPVVDVRSFEQVPDRILADLTTAITQARPLPLIENGANRIAHSIRHILANRP